LSSIYTKFNKIRKTNKIKDFKADEIIKVNIDKEKNKIIKKEKLTSIENNKNNNIVILINK
jgi:hypothetical protein